MYGTRLLNFGNMIKIGPYMDAREKDNGNEMTMSPMVVFFPWEEKLLYNPTNRDTHRSIMHYG